MNRPLGALAIAAVLWASAGANGSRAAGEDLDWTAWKHLPVLDDGRVQPIDTFARKAVRGICGRENPKLALPVEAGTRGAADPAWAEARKLFPSGESRKFTAAEILFSWLVEPEKWQRVPFLLAMNEELRRDVLDVPLLDAQGNRLMHVSPHEVANSRGFRARLEELDRQQREARQEGRKIEPGEVDKKAQELYEAFSLYQGLTFGSPESNARQGRFVRPWMEAFNVWSEIEPSLKHLPWSPAAGEADPRENAQAAFGALNAWLRSTGEDRWDSAAAERELRTVRESSGRLAEQIGSLSRTLQQSPADASSKSDMLVQLRALASKAAEIARLAREAELGLHEGTQPLAIVPALDASALERNRDARDGAQPWLGLHTILRGSTALLNEYPPRELAAVREAFGEAAGAYVNRAAADRGARFTAAMDRFSAAVRTLGEAVEPLRVKLPLRERDEDLIAATAYPVFGATDLEVTYNELDPFLWTWVLSLGAAICLACTFAARRTLFWLGILLLVAGQAMTVAGLAMRVAITGRAPVTSMFETIIFVALVVAVLGLCFALVPLVTHGVRRAWRLTAIPAPGRGLDATAAEEPTGPLRRGVRLGALAARAALAAWVFYVLAMVSYGHGASETAISLLPRTAVDASMPTVNDLVVWLVGLSMLGLAVWFIPRAAVAGVIALATIPAAWAEEGIHRPLAQVVSRKPFALAGAAVAFLAAYVACNATVFDKNINPLMPVLRNNFWLTSHVLTITASYGAGALAWGLGNLALGYYLFGRYRDPRGQLPVGLEYHAAPHLPGDARPSARDAGKARALVRRAPEACSVLCRYVYRATQVAVVLLVAGTILGALWADVSWGRFWGWDSKEVWALISALVYLAVLHGRYAGLFGNFGLAVGSVFGATSILMAWYGVNFVLGTGMHAYASGAGGLPWVLGALAINWLFVLAAWLRREKETRTPVNPVLEGEVLSSGSETKPAGEARPLGVR